MKSYPIVLCVLLLVFACKEAKREVPYTKAETQTLVGNWDNFQQFWLENTETDMHRTETNEKHRHLSLQISENENGQLQAEVHEGRNAKNFIEKISLPEDIKMNGDTLYLSGLTHFENKDPYRFIRTRKFSGWLEMPMEQYPDSIHRKSNLEIHDQGGMAEIAWEGKVYTAELTQLLFGKKLAIMKLAVYDMPIDSVGINSRSISYTWLNPEAKRTGINLRKITTGWTLIEPGYVNSDNTKFKKKEND